MHHRSREDATLLDVLVDGFEKNETLHGFHWRELPMPTPEAAVRKAQSLIAEACRWMGKPEQQEAANGRCVAAWPDLEIRQAGRGVMVRIRAPNFDHWWHEPETWHDDPMSDLRSWIVQEHDSG